jgi:hypothetical protein
MRPVAGIDLLHLPPHSPAVLDDWNLESRDPFIWNVDDVLGVVQEGDVVVVAAEQQDTPVEVQEPIERRAVPERIVPGARRHQVGGLASPGDEARHVIVDERSRRRAQELDEDAVIAIGARGPRVEGRELLEHLPLLAGAEVAAPHLVVVPRAAGVHHQRAVGRQCILERQMDLIGTACDLPHRTDRGVHHQRRAAGDAQ